nr:zinc finger protein 878-like isoform X2 [Aedes albopictus]
MDIVVEGSIDSRPVCRLCLGEEDILDQLGDLHRWISDYISIVIHPNDCLSHSICVNCRERLEEFCDYQQRCVEIQHVQRSESSMIVCDGDTTFTLNQLGKVEAIKKEPGSMENSQQICRLCLGRECVDDVFNYGDLHRWISDYLSIEISNEDSIRRFCCAMCRIRLEEFRNFHLRCLEVQTQLLNSNVTVVKVEPTETTAEDFESSKIVEETHGEQSIQCNVCHKVIKGSKHLKDRLRYHMVIHGPRKYACTMCEKAFVKSSHLKDHMKVHNKIDEEPVECKVCHKMLKNMNSFRVHKISHGPKKHVCVICDKAYAVRQNLKKHMQSHKSKSTFEAVKQHSDHPFRCDVCFKLLKNQISLRYHKKIHQPKRKVCPICNAAFVRSRDLRDHSATHSSSNGTEDGEKHIALPFKCNICPRAYKRYNSLQGHIKTHGPDKYRCSLCSKEFAEQQRLKAHMKTHNKYSAQSVEEIGEAELNKFLSGVPFECKICPLIYHSQKDLSKHILNVHKGKNQTTLGIEKCSPLDMQKSDDIVDALDPFKCTVCRKAFRTKAQLMEHMRKIRAKMTIECSICRERFGSRELLDKHIKDAIHAERSTQGNGNNAGNSMDDDMFEAEEIKVEIQSDSDD